MDPVMIEKLRAMKRYKSRKNRGLIGFLFRLLRLALALVSLGLFLSCPLWIPRVVSFARGAVLFLAAAPSMSRDALLGPVCLFVLCNVIVVLLVGESKIGGEKQKVVDIYDEYARRVGGGIRGAATPVVPAEKVKIVEEEEEEVAEGYGSEGGFVEEEMEEEEEVGEGYGSEGCFVEEEMEEDEAAVLEGDVMVGDVTDEEEEDEVLSADELKRQASDFIANTQRRWVEERKMQGGMGSYRSYRGWAD